MPEGKKKTLLEFVNELHTNKDWQDKFVKRKKKDDPTDDDWKKLVRKELSSGDADIVIDEDAAAVEAALSDKTTRRIVWETAAIVWG